MKTLATSIAEYNSLLAPTDRSICDLLKKSIDQVLTPTASKLWHGHPVWFINDNPIVGYAKLKNCVQLLFWSGQSFDEPGLQVEGSFKAAAFRYTSLDQVNLDDLHRWLGKSKTIQWDYKNIVKHKGQLNRLSILPN